MIQINDLKVEINNNINAYGRYYNSNYSNYGKRIVINLEQCNAIGNLEETIRHELVHYSLDCINVIPSQEWLARWYTDNINGIEALKEEIIKQIESEV